MTSAATRNENTGTALQANTSSEPGTQSSAGVKDKALSSLRKLKRRIKRTTTPTLIYSAGGCGNNQAELLARNLSPDKWPTLSLAFFDLDWSNLLDRFEAYETEPSPEATDVQKLEYENVLAWLALQGERLFVVPIGDPDYKLADAEGDADQPNTKTAASSDADKRPAPVVASEVAGHVDDTARNGSGQTKPAATWTPGLGAGANPDIGKRAALISKLLITEIIKKHKLVIFLFGGGGGSGSGIVEVGAEIAVDLGITAYGAMTNPAHAEPQRVVLAKATLEKLRAIIPVITLSTQGKRKNTPPEATAASTADELRLALPPKTPEEAGPSKAPTGTDMQKVFENQNREYLLPQLLFLIEISECTGLINMDLSDLQAFLERGKRIYFGKAYADRETSIKDLVESLFSSDAQEEGIIKDATGGLILFTCPENSAWTDFEIEEIMSAVREKVKKDGAECDLKYGLYPKSASETKTVAMLLNAPLVGQQKPSANATVVEPANALIQPNVHRVQRHLSVGGRSTNVMLRKDLAEQFEQLTGRDRNNLIWEDVDEAYTLLTQISSDIDKFVDIPQNIGFFLNIYSNGHSKDVPVQWRTLFERMKTYKESSSANFSPEAQVEQSQTYGGYLS